MFTSLGKMWLLLHKIQEHTPKGMHFQSLHELGKKTYNVLRKLTQDAQQQRLYQAVCQTALHQTSGKLDCSAVWTAGTQPVRVCLSVCGWGYTGYSRKQGLSVKAILARMPSKISEPDCLLIRSHAKKKRQCKLAIDRVQTVNPLKSMYKQCERGSLPIASEPENFSRRMLFMRVPLKTEKVRIPHCWASTVAVALCHPLDQL